MKNALALASLLIFCLGGAQTFEDRGFMKYVNPETDATQCSQDVTFYPGANESISQTLTLAHPRGSDTYELAFTRTGISKEEVAHSPQGDGAAILVLRFSSTDEQVYLLNFTNASEYPSAPGSWRSMVVAEVDLVTFIKLGSSTEPVEYSIQSSVGFDEGLLYPKLLNPFAFFLEMCGG